MSRDDAKKPASGDHSPGKPRELFHLRILHCAWCGRETVRPIPDQVDAEVVAHRHLTVSDGICEACFEEHLPGTPYPESD